MSNHRTTIVGSDDAWQGKCTCRLRSPAYPHRWQAEDWNLAHLDTVNRVRANLMNRQPGLADQRDWYRKQEAASSGRARAQWRALADALDHRLGKMPHDDPLF